MPSLEIPADQLTRLFVLISHKGLINTFTTRTNIRCEHSIIKVTGGSTLRFLPRAIQQLKLLDGVDTTSNFLHPRADNKPHFNGPRANK